MLGAVVALSLLGYGALQLIDVFRGDSGKRPTAAGAKDCAKTAANAKTAKDTAGGARGEPAGAPKAAPAAALPQPGQITVNVYNATPRAGLAKAVGEELKKRGFLLGHVGNAPADFEKKVTGPGILLGSPRTDKAAFSVLGAQLAGATPQTDAREGTDIDLILGDSFKELTKKEDADKTVALLAHPKPAPAATC